MVLESIITAIEAEKHPRKLIPFGLLLTVIAIMLARSIFPQYASVVFVFLIVMASIPVMVQIIREEEKKDLGDFKEITLLKEHSKAITAFLTLFLGILLGVMFWYILPSLAILLALISASYFLRNEWNIKPAYFWTITIIISILITLVMHSAYPIGQESQTFSAQIQTLNAINNSNITGQVTAFDSFRNIFFNNMKVLIFCIVFSFIYGAGAIFILTWNASVIGVALGNYLRGQLSQIASWVGLEQVAGYLHVATCGILRYSIHGIPEIAAYFIGALGGGIISVAVIKHHFKSKKFEHIVLDSTDLILLAIGILLLAAVLEVWVTPYVFTSLCQIG